MHNECILIGSLLFMFSSALTKDKDKKKKKKTLSKGKCSIDIWAPLRENLSLGFPTKQVSNQSPQLQRLARKFKFYLKQVYV